jgi:hypothetical protein
MNVKRILTLLLATAFVVGACAGSTPTSAPSQAAASPSEAASTEPSASAPAGSAAPSPLAPDPAEAVIPYVE